MDRVMSRLPSAASWADVLSKASNKTTSKNGLDVNTIAQQFILLGVINAIKDVLNGSLKNLYVGLSVAGSAG